MSAEAASWRDILKNLVSDPHEKERVALALGVRTITLQRWIRGDSYPRPANLRKLLTLFPEHQDALLQAFEIELANLWEPGSETLPSSQHISADVYAQVLQAYSILDSSARFQVMADLILSQVLAQLDPQKQGLAVTLALCVPPQKGQKVRSLRLAATAPVPKEERETRNFLWGAESLAGYAVTSFRPASISLRPSRTWIPVYVPEPQTHEESAAAYPISRGGRLAGAFLASSVISDFFTAPICNLLEKYANLAGLAFEDTDFYALDAIALNIMPPSSIQRNYTKTFRKQVIQVMEGSQRKGQPLSMLQAQNLVWQMLEDELIKTSEYTSCSGQSSL